MKNIKFLAPLLAIMLATGLAFGSDSTSDKLNALMTALKALGEYQTLGSLIKKNQEQIVAAVAIISFAILIIKCPKKQYTQEEIDALEKDAENNAPYDMSPEFKTFDANCAHKDAVREKEKCEKACEAYAKECSTPESKKSEKCQNIATSILKSITQFDKKSLSNQYQATIKNIKSDAKDSIMNGKSANSKEKND